MKRILCLLVTAGLMTGWAQRGGAPNTLTAAEQKEGFVLLFDGKTLNGWDLRPGQEKVWTVVDGAIRNSQTNPGGTMLTKDDFANFVLKAEFRAHPNVNSAIMLRQPRPAGAAAESKAKARDKMKKNDAAGYELQIRDKVLTDRTGGEYLTASIVNVAPAPADVKIIPGQWNTFEVTADGDHLVVLYNGRKTVDVHDSRLKTGALGLQSAHPEDPAGASIEFRSLKVKRLP